MPWCLILKNIHKDGTKINKDFLFAWTNFFTKNDSKKTIKVAYSREHACSCDIRVAFNAIERRKNFITKESFLFIFIKDVNIVNLVDVH